MQLHRTAAVLATAVIAAGMGAGSAHATTGTTAEVDHTKSVFVAVGKLDSFQGNRHQVVLNTAGGSVKSTSRVKSYYCPPGASITASWVSSKCVLRSTHSIRFVDGSSIGRISSSGQSASQRGWVRLVSTSTGRSTYVWSQLSLSSARINPVTGTFAGLSTQSSQEIATWWRG